VTTLTECEGEGRAGRQDDCHRGTSYGSDNTARNKRLNHGFLQGCPSESEDCAFTAEPGVNNAPCDDADRANGVNEESHFARRKGMAAAFFGASS
jgi:hypothetical protein